MKAEVKVEVQKTETFALTGLTREQATAIRDTIGKVEFSSTRHSVFHELRRVLDGAASYITVEYDAGEPPREKLTSEKFSHVRHKLFSVRNWDDTPQGHDYWSSVAEQLARNEKHFKDRGQ